jgi:hypothetical protein
VESAEDEAFLQTTDIQYILVAGRNLAMFFPEVSDACTKINMLTEV